MMTHVNHKPEPTVSTPITVSAWLSRFSARSERPKSNRIARTPSMAWEVTTTRNSTSSTRMTGLRKYATTSAKSRNPPLAMKCRPSNITRLTPVKACQSQLELAFGSCTNGFFIASASIDLQRCNGQHDDGHKHQGAEEDFVCLHTHAKTCNRQTQAIQTVNEYPGKQNDIECQEVRGTRQRPARRILLGYLRVAIVIFSLSS